MSSDLESIWKELREKYGGLIEPFTSWRNADAHRMFWRPDEVKVVLLAESHVFTSEAEAQKKVDLSAFSDDEVPREFVRLVYCLGYGESELLSGDVKGNGGTPQFWKLFDACRHHVASNDGFASVLVRGTPALDERIRNKLKLLQFLKRNGIWLLDASLAALYPRPDVAAMYEDCIDTSWPYISQLIAAASPEQIIVVGAGVRDRLRERINALGISWAWIYQPQAHLSTEDHFFNYRRLYDLVHGADSSTEVLRKIPPGSRPAAASSGQSCYEWTYNGQSGYYSRGRLPLGKSPIKLTLYFRESAESPRSKVVDSVLLDLHELLEGGYIRIDSSTAGESNVRVVIFRDNDGSYYVRSKQGASGYLLN